MKLTELEIGRGVVVAAGMAVREGGEDFNSVFHRADELMYERKIELKIIRPNYNAIR